MSRRGLFCKCLYESDNNLPRTKHCRRPCAAQDLILQERSEAMEEPEITPTIASEDLKTSQEWEQLVPSEFKLIIMDPDGWDRKNFQYSFYEEKITKVEFINRLASSTIMGNLDIFMSPW
jgi:hypothetical protein